MVSSLFSPVMRTHKVRYVETLGLYDNKQQFIRYTEIHSSTVINSFVTIFM